jgi:sugar lactone lactonase YvrE
VPLAKEVRLYAPDGKLARRLAGPSEGVAFTRPMGVTIAPNGATLYVSELSGRILAIPLSTPSPKK